MSIVQIALRRCALMACALALALPATASAQPGGEAAEWLVSQLQPTSEGSFCEVFGEASVGETIECMLAFKAAGAGFEAPRKETYEWVLANKAKYVGGTACETTTGPLSAGAVAKLALAVEAQGGDPTNVGGRNLIKDLQCLQVSSGAEAGRFSDKNQTDFSNVSGQSLAIVALKACEVGCPGKPNLKASIEAGAAYLRSQQCAKSKPASLNGAFRSTMGLAPNTCNNKAPFPEEGPENANAVEVDSTANAVQALLSSGASEARSAAETGVKWLKKQQKKSKFWQNYCSFTESTVIFPSVNSTALGIMAYVEDGVTGASLRGAQKWLEGIVKAQPSGQRGLPACGEAGPPDVIATAQGVLGLFGASYPHLVGLP